MSNSPSKKTNTSNKLKPLLGLLVLGISCSAFGYAYYSMKVQPWDSAYGRDTSALDKLKGKSPKVLIAGDLTHFRYDDQAYAQEATALPWGLSAMFDEGDGNFERPFVAAVVGAEPYIGYGLGPLFNGDSCETCHVFDGRAAPPQMSGEPLAGLLFRVSVPGKGINGGPKPHSVYGGQLADKAVPGHKPEVDITIEYEELPGVYADGRQYSLRKPTYTIKNSYYGPMGEGVMISPRVAPHIAGLGLLDALTDQAILSNADPDDKNGDGISGRAQMVWDVRFKKMSLGKYGWKAETPTVEQQAADAAINDMGISNPLFAAQNCTDKQLECKEATHGTYGSAYEMSEVQLEDITTYLEFLGIPGRGYLDDPEVVRGEQLFDQVSCSGCHVKSFVTGTEHRRKRLRNQTISPFTDLLLHDMGPGLADHRPSYDADGYEWRTAPLWGIGMTKTVNGHTNFLHDGRARNLEEAILWHGGEAESSKQQFIAMELKDRESLVKFLKSI